MQWPESREERGTTAEPCSQGTVPSPRGHLESTGEPTCRGLGALCRAASLELGILLSQSIFRSREAFASLLGCGRDACHPSLSLMDRTPRWESLAVPPSGSFSVWMYSRAEEQESLLI